MSLITLGPADDDAIAAATRYVRAIFFCKLLLSALLIPILIAALFELPHIYDDAESQFQATPILAGLTVGTFCVAIGLLCLKAFAVYVPIFGPVCGEPLHYRLWHSTMFTVGLLLDAIVFTPRVFLGSAKESLTNSQPTDPAHALFTKDANALLLILIAPFALATYLAWRPFYTGYIAQARAEYETKYYLNLTIDELDRWLFFDEHVRDALNARTRDEAFDHITGLSRSVTSLPYRDERDRQDAANHLDSMADRILKSPADQNHPAHWSKVLSDLHSLRRYIPKRSEIPGPVVDPMPFEASLAFSTPTESLLPPPRVADQRASNTNSVTPSNGTPGPFQTEPPAPANREPPEPSSRPTADKESLLPTPTSPPQPKQRESMPAADPERPRTNRRQVPEPTSPATTPENAKEDTPPNPFQKGTTWTGTSMQVSDGINPANDGIQIQVELSITRHDAEGFEGTVRNPSVIDAQGRRVRWGATATATGTYRNGEVTIRTTPRSVPAGTVLLPGTWTGTVEDGIFSGEFRGPNNSLSEVTLQLRAAPQRRGATK